MCVNDLIVQGAKPIVFLDYIAIPKVIEKKYKQILSGIAKGCRIAGCSLSGGETAEMPGVYTGDSFDLAGFAVGIVGKKNVITGNSIKHGDIVLGVPSTGAHSNGYSLIRKILKDKKIKVSNNKKLYKNLLTPTKIYVNEILKLHRMKLIKGCAHITGGGIIENIPRVIPDNYSAKINLSKIKTNKVIKWIKSNGVNDHEMLKTFNCGVGFCIIADKKNYKKILKVFNKSSKPYEIGTIIKSNNNKKIILNEKINWKY
jgi:phosphoribosylformylglycinamidine cyclo-ligase